MSNVFHRSNVTHYPTAVKGEGVYIIDKEGKRYFDACSGAAVSCLGHSNTYVQEAITHQIKKLAYAHTGFFTTGPMEELATWLANKAPKGIDHVYFVSGGSEAVEAAIKLARQYFVEKGQLQRKYIIARWQSYHGNTLGALATGGNRWRREPFQPLLIEVKHISPCYAYRGKEENESLHAYGQRVANELEEKIQELGAENIIGFMAEPVVGATMGCVPGVEGYYKRIEAICRQHKILLILDEVMCGMGRTGTTFACEQDGIVPDIITIAKGLGAGYQPIGAMLASSEIYNTITEGSGFFQHGHTYMGHTTACAAALAVQQFIEKEALLERVKSLGRLLAEKLTGALGDMPYVGDIRGKGLFTGVEFVKDKKTKVPFEPSLKIHAKIKNLAMEQGLMCYAMGGTIDGRSGNHVMFAPPFIINEKDIDFIAATFQKVVKQALEG